MKIINCDRFCFALRKMVLGYSIFTGIASLCFQYPLHCTQTASYYNIVSGKEIHIEEDMGDKLNPLIYSDEYGKKLRVWFGLFFPVIVLLPILVAFLWYWRKVKGFWLLFIAPSNIALLYWQSRLWRELGGERASFMMGNTMFHTILIYFFISLVSFVFFLRGNRIFEKVSTH